MMKKILPLTSFFLLLIIDQWSKYLVRKHFSLFESFSVIDNIFHLTYIENTGVAFGLFAGKTMLFVTLSSVILIVLLIYMYRFTKGSSLPRYGVAFVCAGAIGNMIDRVMKSSVTDMFDFRIWPIFNVADIAVCLGFLVLAIYLFISEEQS